MAVATPGEMVVREWKWRLLLIAFAFILTGGLLGASLTVAAYGPTVFDWILGVGLVGGVTAYMTWSVRRDGIREVRVSSDQVGFQTGRQLISVPWSELRPPKYPLFWGDVSFYFPERLGPLGAVGTDLGRMAVTRRQAIAILTHPSCPLLQTPAEVLSSLGLNVT